MHVPKGLEYLMDARNRVHEENNIVKAMRAIKEWDGLEWVGFYALCSALLYSDRTVAAALVRLSSGGHPKVARDPSKGWRLRYEPKYSSHFIGTIDRM